jgi:hypothetical protein
MQTQLFVAPDGNDKNAGTIDAPLATIEAALEKVKTSYGAVIWLRGGIYSDKVTIKNVNGTAVSPVIISAYKDEKPIFTAGKSLSPSDFAPVDYSKDKVAQRIPEKAKENVVCVNLKELGWTDEDIGAISSAGLPKFYIDSKITNIARYPNAGETELYFEYVYDTGSVTAGPIHSDLYEGWIKRVQSGEFDKNPDVTFYTDDHGNRNLDWGWAIRMIDLTPFRWVNTGNIWYFGNVFEGWETGIYNIKSFDIRTQKLTSKTGSSYGAKHSTNSPTRHNNFYYFNVIEALDTPGEWFYDVDTGNMYVYKTEGFENAQLFYATKTEDDIFYVTTCKNMIFNGISIDISGRYGMNILSSDGIIVQGCEIKNTASYGIVVGYKTVNSAVTYCDFSSTGSAMIYAQTTGYPQGTLLPTRFVIQNNYLHDPMENKHTGITAGGYLSVVSHNRLEDCNINISNASECIVEYNDVSGGSRTVSDGGLIYLYSLYNHGVHIRYNYLHDFKAAGCGVYLDDMAFSHYAYYNIVDTTTATTDKSKAFLYTSSGRYNVFFGNILVGREIDRINESTLFIPGTRFNSHFIERMKEYTELLPQKYILTKFYARFPELELYYNMMKKYVNDIKQAGYTINENEIYLRTPQNNVVANNVVLGSKAFFNQDVLDYKNPLTNQYSTSSDLIANNYIDMDINSVLADYRNGDFSIRSEALTKVTAAIPNFKPLSTEGAGLTYELVK